MLFIFGDSHTRSFMNRKNTLPFFFGQGQKFNLNNLSYNNIINNINIFFLKKDSNIDNNDIFFLYFGEPNCRFLVDYNYYPFKKDMTLWNEYKNDKNKLIKIDNYIDNYIKIVEVIKNYTNNYYIITPTTGFTPTLFYLSYFNKKLKKTFGEKVIDLCNKTYDSEYKVNSNYLNKNLQYDPIHLNDNIYNVFIDILLEKNIINDKINYCYDLTINKNYKKHTKFNTYLI